MEDGDKGGSSIRVVYLIGVIVRRPEAWRLICNIEQYLGTFNEGIQK